MNPSTEQILISGKVQGVGFRWTTKRLTAELPVAGFVRNLADGRVEIVVTGEVGSIDELISRLKARFGSGISTIERQTRPNLEDFSGFDIRR